MASAKRLRSVCHSIAHHAASGLSYIHPHIGEACRRSGVASAQIDLLAEFPYPGGLPESEPLRLALGGLREKLEGILLSEGMSLSELSRASLSVELLPGLDNYCCNCTAALALSEGTEVSYVVNYLGQQVAPNNSLRARRP